MNAFKMHFYGWMLVRLILALTLFAPSFCKAQGITYLSSLSPNSTGSAFVGSDSWLAAEFQTGSNGNGYVLNSIQLGMTGASGNPSDFSVMIYSAVVGPGVDPGSSLGSLSGSLSPATAGIYTYTPVSTLMLSPRTDYFLVLTAGTAIANGAYDWSKSAYPPTGSWFQSNSVLYSPDGISNWAPTKYSGIAQLAINATPVPEPGIVSLFCLGGLLLFWRVRQASCRSNN